MDEMHAHCLDEKLCLKQANRLKMDADSEDGTRRRVFMKLFTTSHLGLNITNTSIGKRDNGAQSKFRADLLKISESRHPDKKRDLIWCPVTGGYHQEVAMVAAHLFSYRHGQDTMDAIFGRNATSELFSPYNGILMNNTAESFFDKGYYVIVPQVSATPSLQEIKDWHKVEPKNYQIRVLEPDVKAMNQFIGETDRLWRDLDGQKVLFRGNFRPRARYLYFTYCMAILRKSWNKDKPTTALSDELGKPYWGTAGRYIKKNMLQGFVQELGHDYEALLEGAISDSSNEEEVGLAALEAANDQIKVSVRGEDGLSYEQGSGSDDEGEDDSD